MPAQQEQHPKERVFGLNGETEEDVIEHEPAEPPVVPEPTDDDPEPPLPPAAAASAQKYRIGDKFFATQAEAVAYAESQVGSSAEIDAYRQVLRETVAGVPRAPAPQPEPEDVSEIYTDPAGFLRKRDERIKNEVLQQVDQRSALAETDNRLWSEFRERHPDLTDFRQEITLLAQQLQPEVQGVIRTKGQAAAYDYVATKFKAQAERINSALKPKRVLRETPVHAATGGNGELVTPKRREEKPLSLVQQLRQIRRKA